MRFGLWTGHNITGVCCFLGVLNVGKTHAQVAEGMHRDVRQRALQRCYLPVTVLFVANKAPLDCQPWEALMEMELARFTGAASYGIRG